MDVHCSTCREPWSVHHLWYDAIWDTSLSEPDVQQWEKLPQNEKLSPPWREHFTVSGWIFGRTMLNVVRCPCCPKDALPSIDAIEIKGAIEEILGDDQDAIAAAFADHDL